MVLGAILTAAGGSIAGDIIKNKYIAPAPAVSPGIWSKTYRYLGNDGNEDEIDTLAANSYASVNISENDYNRYGPFNGGFVQNDSDENIMVLLNGQLDRALHIAKKSSGSLSNHKFRSLKIYNLSATAPSNDEISITVQKIKELV